MFWCSGSCTMTGQVNKSGHAEMRNSFNNGIMSLQIYAKGTHEFDAQGQLDGYMCRYVLTWKKS